MEGNLNHEQVTDTSSLSCSSHEDRVVLFFPFLLPRLFIPGSCDNLIAEEAVQKLGLKTKNRPKPYKLKWLKRGGGDSFQACSCFVFDELEMGDDIFVLIGKEVAEDSKIPEAMIPLLEPHYRMSPGEHEELCRQVEELISKGHVRKSMSPYAVPSLLTPKKDGTWRMCVDSRAINKITVRYRFPIPRLDDLLDQISGATIFTKLDLKSGYYQIRLRPGDEWKTAFKTHEGLYDCASFNEHVTHVRQVLALLRKDNFYAATKKCVFMTPKVLFLGYVVSSYGIRVDESKVTAVQEWPTPTTITKVRSFHGLASFYRRFIPNFSSIMAHLTDCMKGKSFVWTEEAELAFQVVKEKFTTAPILVLPNFSKVFELHTNASKVAIGGVLSQGG
nr:putative reverse transcriptase domain-containing protein [Tanacetum cinerariifolium]